MTVVARQLTVQSVSQWAFQLPSSACQPTIDAKKVKFKAGPLYLSGDSSSSGSDDKQSISSASVATRAHDSDQKEWPIL